MVSDEIRSLADAVRQDHEMMSIANDMECSREVFAVLLSDHDKQPDYGMLTRLMFYCGNAGCLLDLVHFALERGHATRLAKVFMEVTPVEGRDDRYFLVDFWDCDEATEAFALLIYELSPNLIQRWVNFIRDNSEHWLLTIQARVDVNLYWSKKVEYYLKRRRPDLKRAHETMIQATQGFNIAYPGESMESLLLRCIFGRNRHNLGASLVIDDETLRSIVNQVFSAHAVAGLLPTDAANDLGVTDDWNRRLMLNYQRNHDKLVSYQSWVSLPCEHLVARLAVYDYKQADPVVGMTRESARLRTLLCYYQDLNFEKHRRKLIKKHGEPTNT
jgi:hypothetical protein